jgi:hypothetical protein
MMMMMMMRLVLVLLVQETRNDNALPSPGLTEGLVVMLGNASVRGTGEVADEDGGDVPEPRQWQCVPCRSSLGGGPCPRRNEGESRGAVLTLEFRSFHAHSARNKENPPTPRLQLLYRKPARRRSTYLPQPEFVAKIALYEKSPSRPRN